MTFFAAIGLTATILFGVWTVLSYNATVDANGFAQKQLVAQNDPAPLNLATHNNQLQSLQNQLELLAICATREQAVEVCDVIIEGVDFRKIANAVLSTSLPFSVSVAMTVPVTRSVVQTTASGQVAASTAMSTGSAYGGSVGGGSSGEGSGSGGGSGGGGISEGGGSGDSGSSGMTTQSSAPGPTQSAGMYILRLYCTANECSEFLF